MFVRAARLGLQGLRATPKWQQPRAATAAAAGSWRPMSSDSDGQRGVPTLRLDSALQPPRVNPALKVTLPPVKPVPPQTSLSLRGRHFVSLKDFSKPEILQLLSTASALKWYNKVNEGNTAKLQEWHPLEGETVGMIFQKRSTRTRVSTEVAMHKLGGHALFLGAADIQLGENENVADSARVLSRFNSLVLARVFQHQDVLDLCAHSGVPIINALSDTFHPLQILADLMTLQERFARFGRSLEGKTIAWVGDGNNVLHSFMVACPRLGINLRVATPAGYEPDEEVIAASDLIAYEEGTQPVYMTHSPTDAVEGAHVVVTDTWVSMGQEEENAQRLKAFEGYQVTHDMCRNAQPDWCFLHCLPRKPYEVDDAVFYDETRSAVFDAAENRLWTVMSVMLHLLRDDAGFDNDFYSH